MEPWLGFFNAQEADAYASILVFLGFGLFVSLLFLVLSYVRGMFRPSAEKSSPYECGFDPASPNDLPFSMPFYLVAILFIIFDIEIALLFPWAVNLISLGWAGFGHAMLFLSVLGAGFLYEWRSGALEWK